MTPPTDATRPAASYFVCGTPRTGSSLLLGLLDSTGVAGRPQAYFRSPDEPLWAERWRIPRTPEGAFDYADYVAAAISAGTTGNGEIGGGHGNGHAPGFDRERIGRLIETIAEHNAAWEEWFAAHDVRPYRVRYEELVADRAGTTRRVLGDLGLRLPEGRVITPRHRRQADELNAQWIDRYRNAPS